MNWLAHVALSPSDTDHQLGNLLADFLRGRKWPEMSSNMRAGLRLHQQIDSFTDSHDCWRQSCARLSDRGLLRGVVIDVVYDHMLTRHWDNFATQSLRDFLDDFYRKALPRTSSMPEDAAAFIQSITDTDRLGRYGETESLHFALERIDGRLSERIRRRVTTSQYATNIAEAYDGIEEDFLKFYPELIAHAKDRLAEEAFAR